jgi:hypothetical protein
MTKEFVPYQESLELKALGFDEPCFAYRAEGAEVMIKYIPNCVISAPTFSQAFRWFRENHNVHSSPKRYDETKWWVEWGTWTSPVFETYEEAELAWLNKLIEIVKNK